MMADMAPEGGQRKRGEKEDENGQRQDRHYGKGRKRGEEIMGKRMRVITVQTGTGTIPVPVSVHS